MTSSPTPPRKNASSQRAEGERKAGALALYGATSGIAAVVGQIVGGLLVSANIASSSWRPIFLVNVPVGVIVLLVATRIVPATRSPRPAGIDLPAPCCSRPPSPPCWPR